MRRRIVVPRRAFAPLILCGLLTLAACSKGKEVPDSVAAGAKPATLAALATPRVVQSNLPGALTKPLDSLSGDELYAFTRKLAFGGGAEQERKCKGSSDCDGAKPKKTRVRVDAVDGQDSVSVNGLPNNGVVAIKALNRGTEPDSMYGMKPDKNLEYFLVLLPATDSLGRWRLEELDTTSGSRRHTKVASGTFRPCWHAFVRHKVNRANFYTCADAHMADSVTKSGLALAAADAPLWVDCAQGCCMATMP